MEFPKQDYWNGLLFPSAGESSQPRDWTQVSCIAGGFFTIWDTRCINSLGVTIKMATRPCSASLGIQHLLLAGGLRSSLGGPSTGLLITQQLTLPWVSDPRRSKKTTRPEAAVSHNLISEAAFHPLFCIMFVLETNVGATWSELHKGITGNLGPTVKRTQMSLIWIYTFILLGGFISDNNQWSFGTKFWIGQ